jgi:antitoxin MazE
MGHSLVATVTPARRRPIFAPLGSGQVLEPRHSRHGPAENWALLGWYVRGCYHVRTMEKRLTKTGNSLALVLDREILDKTGITAETTLEISTDGDVIVVTPKRTKARAEKLRQVMTEADARYAGVFRRLAK